MQVDLTRGSVLKNIAVFSLPYLLSYFLQTLYGMADLYIAGQFNGADVISAVAIGSQVLHMLTVIIVGLSMGGSVLIGRAVGAKDESKVSSTSGTMIVLFAFFSVALTVILLFCVNPIVSLMSTPRESVKETELYLTICFSALPFITAYNVIASLFRGLGDSKSPMFFIAFACILNILLDFVFMGVFGMQASGAALATVISQFASVAVSFFFIRKKRSGLNIKKEDLRLNKGVALSLLKIGLPVACQDGFIQVSFLVITIIANRRGVSVAAAVGIVEKIISFLFLVPSTMLSCISAIASQCLGAGEWGRAKKTLFYGTCIAVGVGALFALLGNLFSEAAVALFTQDADVVRFGSQYFRSYVLDCIVAAVHFSFSGYFCATGLSLVSFIHNALSIVLVRIPGAWLSAKLWPDTLYPMGLAAPLGSLLSALICVAVFLCYERKKKFRNYSAS